MLYNFQNRTDFPKTRLLQINSCGSEKITTRGYTIDRPYGRNDFHFLYIKSGWLEAEIGNKQVKLKKGDCAIFYPNERQKYTFSTEGKPITLWLHFTGDAAAEAMKDIKRKEISVYRISEKILFEGLCIKLNQIHRLGSPAFICEENSILLQLIAILVKESHKNMLAARNEIIDAMEYLSSNMAKPVNLERYTEKLNISYSRFVHLFKEAVGISPHQYLLKLRLERAEYLLKYSTMNITEIAQSVGIEDSYYFSRIFKKKYGISPRLYRNQHKSEKIIYDS